MGTRILFFLILFGLAGLAIADDGNPAEETPTPVSLVSVTVTPVVTPRVLLESSTGDGLVPDEMPSGDDPLKPTGNENQNEVGNFHPTPGVDELNPDPLAPTVVPGTLPPEAAKTPSLPASVSTTSASAAVTPDPTPGTPMTSPGVH
jgi:hypothetical protein